MSFPYGNFDLGAPVNAHALADAKDLLAALPTVPANGINRIYLHWSVSPYSDTFSDYNGSAYMASGYWTMGMTHDPRDNVAGLDAAAPASHTWHRNTGAVGVAISAMEGASQANFGSYPVTVAGLEYLCACAAAFASKYGVDASGVVPAPGADHEGDSGPVNTAGEPSIITHAEAAIFDGYYCGYTSDPNCRWDLAAFEAKEDGGSILPETAVACGTALRSRIHAYKLALRA